MAGRKQLPKNKIKDALRKAEGTLPKLIKTLESIAYGKAITCPHCQHLIEQAKPDREAIIALMNRIAGLPTAKHELDVTTKLQLTGEECRLLVEYAMAVVQEQGDIPALEGEYKLLAEHGIQSPELGRTNDSSIGTNIAHRTDAEQPRLSEEANSCQAEPPEIHPPVIPSGTPELVNPQVLDTTPDV